MPNKCFYSCIIQNNGTIFNQTESKEVPNLLYDKFFKGCELEVDKNLCVKNKKIFIVFIFFELCQKTFNSPFHLI